jgi:nucleotide-binding universal stress UspA family protein
MMVTCPTCGTEVPTEVAVDVVAEGEHYRFCSARCADVRLPEGEAAPGPPAAGLPRRFLVAVDGSGPSMRAVERAAALAALTHGEVRLLHAIDLTWFRSLGEAPIGIGPIGTGLQAAEMERAIRADAEAQLERGVRICERAGVPVRTAIATGRPVEVIVDAARDADLVVLGSRGRGAISGALLGSVSQRVIGGTQTPVLVVH